MELITVGKIYTYEPEYEGYTIYGNETSRINKMSELVYIKCNNDNFHHLESRRFIDVTWEIRNEKLESLGI